MPTIREILEARDDIAVNEMGKGETTYDDLMRILHNKRVRQNRSNPNKKKGHKKEYLSKADRETFIKLAAVTATINETLQTWQECNKPTEWSTWLKTANTWVFKTLTEMFRGVPAAEVQKVIKDIAYHRIMIAEYEPRKKEA